MYIWHCLLLAVRLKQTSKLKEWLTGKHWYVTKSKQTWTKYKVADSKYNSSNEKNGVIIFRKT